MYINDTDYILNENFHSGRVGNKKQIVLCHSNMYGMLHYDYWVNRTEGYYKKTAPYSVDEDGNIYKHYNPSYSSGMFVFDDINDMVIPIMLSNLGALYLNGSDELYNTMGFKIEDGNYQSIKWKRRQYFYNYTEEQLDSVVELSSYLCEEYGIQKNAMNTNVKDDYILYFNGISYRSNYSSVYYDLNPTWYFRDFKNKLEKKHIKNAN